MLNWLKKFEESSLGMLFTDQHLSPSEVVRIAQRERCPDQTNCSSMNSKTHQDRQSRHVQLIGLR